MEKAQTSVEALLLVGFMMMVLIVFLLALSNKMVDAQIERDRAIIIDLSDFVSNEIELASAANNGYARSFELPQNLEGRNYTITFVNSATLDSNHSEITIKYFNYSVNYEAVIIAPKNTYGSIFKGTNVITKNQGIIRIN